MTGVAGYGRLGQMKMGMDQFQPKGITRVESVRMLHRGLSIADQCRKACAFFTAATIRHA